MSAITVINVTDHFQTGDPDWTAAFNRARTAQVNQGGGMIWIPIGLYPISSLDLSGSTPVVMT